MPRVTERQQSILSAIMEYTEKNKYAPSIRELCVNAHQNVDHFAHHKVTHLTV